MSSVWKELEVFVDALGDMQGVHLWEWSHEALAQLGESRLLQCSSPAAVALAAVVIGLRHNRPEFSQGYSQAIGVVEPFVRDYSVLDMPGTVAVLVFDALHNEWITEAEQLTRDWETMVSPLQPVFVVDSSGDPLGRPLSMLEVSVELRNRSSATARRWMSHPSAGTREGIGSILRFMSAFVTSDRVNPGWVARSKMHALLLSFCAQRERFLGVSSTLHRPESCVKELCRIVEGVRSENNAVRSLVLERLRGLPQGEAPCDEDVIDLVKSLLRCGGKRSIEMIHSMDQVFEEHGSVPAWDRVPVGDRLVAACEGGDSSMVKSSLDFSQVSLAQLCAALSHIVFHLASFQAARVTDRTCMRYTLRRALFPHFRSDKPPAALECAMLQSQVLREAWMTESVDSLLEAAATIAAEINRRHICGEANHEVLPASMLHHAALLPLSDAADDLFEQILAWYPRPIDVCRQIPGMASRRFDVESRHFGLMDRCTAIGGIIPTPPLGTWDPLVGALWIGASERRVDALLTAGADRWAAYAIGGADHSNATLSIPTIFALRKDSARLLLYFGTRGFISSPSSKCNRGAELQHRFTIPSVLPAQPVAGELPHESKPWLCSKLEAALHVPVTHAARLSEAYSPDPVTSTVRAFLRHGAKPSQQSVCGGSMLAQVHDKVQETAAMTLNPAVLASWCGWCYSHGVFPDPRRRAIPIHLDISTVLLMGIVSCSSGPAVERMVGLVELLLALGAPQPREMRQTTSRVMTRSPKRWVIGRKPGEAGVSFSLREFSEIPFVLLDSWSERWRSYGSGRLNPFVRIELRTVMDDDADDGVRIANPIKCLEAWLAAIGEIAEGRLRPFPPPSDGNDSFYPFTGVEEADDIIPQPPLLDSLSVVWSESRPGPDMDGADMCAYASVVQKQARESLSRRLQLALNGSVGESRPAAASSSPSVTRPSKAPRLCRSGRRAAAGATPAPPTVEWGWARDEGVLHELRAMDARAAAQERRDRVLASSADTRGTDRVVAAGPLIRLADHDDWQRLAGHRFPRQSARQMIAPVKRLLHLLRLAMDDPERARLMAQQRWPQAFADVERRFFLACWRHAFRAHRE